VTPSTSHASPKECTARFVSIAGRFANLAKARNVRI
jgi:hypothetical protein